MFPFVEAGGGEQRGAAAEAGVKKDTCVREGMSVPKADGHRSGCVTGAVTSRCITGNVTLLQ